MSDEEYESGSDASSNVIYLSRPALIVGEAQKGCEKCGGSGYLGLGTTKVQRCSCTVLDFAKKYLTPNYTSVAWDRKLDITPFIDKNLFIISKTNAWKSLVKTYLLRTSMQYSHVTTAPRHLITAHLRRIEAPDDSQAITKAGLLILHMQFDPANVAYGLITASYIQDRLNEGRHTWIVAPQAHTEPWFAKTYDQQGALVPLITTHFHPTKAN